MCPHTLVTFISINDLIRYMCIELMQYCLLLSYTIHINSFHASGDLCRLLITFANSLDPDQARQNVGPDLDPNCLTL